MFSKRNRSVLLLAISLITFIVFIGCEDSASPGLTGNITGFITLYTGSNDVEIEDNSGVRVSLEGTNYSAVTNKEGKYYIRNVRAGIYNVVFEKEGFEKAKLIAKEFTGGGTAFYGTYGLIMLPLFYISDISHNINQNDSSYSVQIFGTFEDPSYSGYKRLLLFFNDTPDISELPGEHIDIYIGFNMIQQPNNFNVSLDKFYFEQQLGFNSGDTVYVKAHTTNSSYSGYYDVETGEFILINLSDQYKELSFVLP